MNENPPASVPALPAPPIFLIGAPRSGTTWLQSMLGAHPEIATPQETHLISNYVAPAWDRWQRQLAGANPSGRCVGLINCFTEAEFEEWLRRLVLAAFGNVLARKPGASVLLEKTPSHSLQVALINRLLPDARFIHLVRDGRDMAVSCVEAARDWAIGWAPRSIAEAARAWRRYVSGAREASVLDGRYLEVRYERLLEDGVPALRELFGFLSVEADAALCAEIYRRNDIERLRETEGSVSSVIRGGEVLARYGPVPRERKQFFREGRAGGWHAYFSPRDRWVFDRVAGKLLVELGYAEPGWPEVGPLAGGLFRVAAAAEARARRWLRLQPAGRRPVAGRPTRTVAKEG